MQNPFRIGRLVYLRPLEVDDAPHLQKWINDPEVTRTLAVHMPWNLEKEKEFLAKMQGGPNDVLLGIARLDEDRVIGGTALHAIDWKNRQAMFGIFIGDKLAWGKGFGGEATTLMTSFGFETLNLNRIWLKVYEHNPAAIHVYEKVGYRTEGVLRQDHYSEGRYWNSLVMAVLREEWEARRGS